MPTYKKRPDFFSSDEGVLAFQLLEAMDLDDGYYTGSSYSPNTELYPNNQIPFVDKHMYYLRNHPDTNMQQYISNLRLMTKVK